MNCPACSATIPDGAAFCSQCGAKLGAATPQAATATKSPGNLGRRQIADTPEVTLWEGAYSPKAMLGPFLGGLLLSIALIVGGVMFANWIIPAGVILVIWLLLVARLIVNRLGIHYKLTNHMFYHRRGLLTREIDRIEVITIDDVKWSQSLLERITGVGTITIFSPIDRTTTSGNGSLAVPGIEDVEKVALLIDKARRDERVRRGFLTIEQTSLDAPAG